MIIYKITNTINEKVYIGLTTTSLKTRWQSHKGSVKSNPRPLYRAMRKYGIENFTIEVIDETDSMEKLAELERSYIKKYNSRDPQFGYNLAAGGQTSALDDNGRAKLTLNEVIQIREIYSHGELRCKKCWEMYKNKISFSAFQKIWEGTTWKNVLPEIYTSDMKKLHSKQKSNPGEINSNAIYTDAEVLEFRKYYVNHSLKETFDKYSRSSSLGGFRNTLTISYNHLPKYSKVKKMWTLNNIPINIENYKPVSTISESGE